ncbi:MAG: ABC transporter substrate-binding protein [Campylobacteraceae bacterium]|jgi:NitT/TauT family transport system substrate-binding protein|nr:ABC transporter substrate-binding protein [Campylobacteraceae bacterium]
MKKLFLITFAFIFLVYVKAEQSELRIAKQYGLAYLPFIFLEENKLLEKNAKKAGLGDVKVSWVTLGGGAAANDALLSGSVDIISGGVPPVVILWDKSKGKVKAIASLVSQNIVLLTANPNIKSLKDFTPNDKIALPSVKVSTQALLLQIAAAKEFGIKNYDKFDHLTVALKHPDALIALTSGRSEITAHFGQEPFSSIELKNANIHKVLSADEVLGGGSINLISATEKFYTENPKLARVLIDSLDEANEWINANKKAAAELYVKASNSKEPLDLVYDIINSDSIVYSTKFKNVTVFSDFLYETGAIKSKPTQEELFFDEISKKKELKK